MTGPDIQQYGARGPLSDPPSLGEYVVVTYADHVAALLTQDRQHMEQQSAAVAAARAEQQIVSNALGFKLGKAAGVKAASDEVVRQATARTRSGHIGWALLMAAEVIDGINALEKP
jgi:hypothetical protein